MMPFLNLFMARGQFVMTGVEKIFEHPEQVEIHEARLVIEQKFGVNLMKTGMKPDDMKSVKTLAAAVMAGRKA